jgi:exodeoxyribonuclease VII large subunit
VAVHSVSQVTAYLKESLESDPLLADLTVEAEVSNLRVSGAGHSYFTLKDDQSVLNCVMFRGRPGAELLANGDAVLAHGHITFYEPRGSTEYMVDMAMAAGVGELALELERLTVRLEAEGLFEQSRKRALPQFPQVIGVVTSMAGAVFHDIENVVRRRYPLAELLIAPSLVQGDSAAPDIVNAIGQLNHDGRADVIIVARGGGSLEELWPFNEEVVARAIYASRIPVVSAVGHETDFTIADRVADRRAPTPSAAAELVVPDQDELKRQLRGLEDYLYRHAANGVAARTRDLADLSRRLERNLPDTSSLRRRVDDLARTSGVALINRLKVARLSVENRAERIRALDPTATLRRGYSVVQQKETGKVVTSPEQVSDGESLSITAADGDIPATVGAGGASKSPRRTRKAAKQAPAMERLL